MKKLTLFLFLSFSFLFSSQVLLKAENQILEENKNSQVQNDEFDMDDLNFMDIEIKNENPNPNQAEFKKTFLESITEAKNLAGMVLRALWKESKKELYNDTDKILTCGQKTKVTLNVTKKILKELNNALLTPAGKKIFTHLQTHKYKYLTAATITIALIKYKTIQNIFSK